MKTTVTFTLPSFEDCKVEIKMTGKIAMAECKWRCFSDAAVVYGTEDAGKRSAYDNMINQIMDWADGGHFTS